MRVLVFAHMYPSPRHPAFGIFVQQQVASLRRAGVEVDVLHVDVKRGKWRYPWSYVPFLRRALTQRYDLVHAHYVFAGVVARSQFRFPLVLTHHGDETFHGWQAPLCRAVSRVVDKNIVVSEQVKRAIGQSDAAVVPCGVDMGLFCPLPQEQARAALGLPAGKKLVLFASAYSRCRGKRPDIAQAAVALLREGGEDVELVSASGRPYREMPLFMNACDALVFPSEREGSPQVVKEALACNLPVVSADVGDVGEILDGVDGCCICRRDAAEIAGELARVLALRRRSDGRAKAQRYELQHIAAQIVRVYESVLAQR